MTNRERLQENYEDALFALLLDDVAQTEGKSLIQENEALQADPNAAVPANIDRRCMQVIQRTLAKQKHGASLRNLGQQICRAAVIVAIITSLFISAYAFSPSFRTETLNLLLEIDDKLAAWRFDDSGLTPLPEESDPANNIEFDIGKVPSGYTITDIKSYPNQVHVKYKNVQGIQIEVDVFKVTDVATFTYDVEVTDHYEEITLDGLPAILINKDGILTIAWAQKEAGLFVNIYSSGISIDEIEDFARELT